MLANPLSSFYFHPIHHINHKSLGGLAEEGSKDECENCKVIHLFPDASHHYDTTEWQIDTGSR